jgi:hypothetical protein
MKNSNSLDTARDILEKALDSLGSFAGGIVPEAMENYNPMKIPDWKADFHTVSDFYSKTGWESCRDEIINNLAAREEKQKEAIKALDIEKLIKLIREA